MHDQHINEGVMGKTLHLMIIIPFFHNECHLFNAAEEIVRYVKHSESSEVHEELDMV